jgi:hypothetical protein
MYGSQEMVRSQSVPSNSCSVAIATTTVDKSVPQLPSQAAESGVGGHFELPFHSQSLEGLLKYIFRFLMTRLF